MNRYAVVVITISFTLAGGCASDDAANSSTAVASVAPNSTVVGETIAPTEPTAPAVTVPLVEGSVALTPFADGLQSPVDLAWRAGDPALYIVEQEGTIVPVVDGVRGDPVLDITKLVTSGGERGLLGLAFDPVLPLAYVDYTDNNSDTVIDEFAVADDGTFDESSRRTVLNIKQPYENHNGGDVAFGPDGYLYIGMGDGGSGGDPERRALSLSQPLGKLLRIDPHASGDAAYTVPDDNPFVDTDGARGEIWSFGLRNPWRFSFDSATGDLWIGDVGQGEWEEVDVAHAVDGGGRGVNYGWSAFEGTHPYNGDQSAEDATPPIHEYQHGDDGCSISGGAVYRGDRVPSLRGWYLFGDYCSGLVWALQEVPGAEPVLHALGNGGNVSAIVAGPDGEMYVVDLGGRLLLIDAA
ncbi:PQQ-dependent sugar dehydrogenase [soil metagenome]